MLRLPPSSVARSTDDSRPPTAIASGGPPSVPAERAIDALAQDPALARLDAIPPPFDPLEVLGWSRRERAHTRFLAWLLDPTEPRPGAGHGLRTAYLHRFVSVVLAAVDGLPGAEGATRPHEIPPIDPSTVRVVREQPVGDGIRATARAPDLRVHWRDLADRASPRDPAWLLLIENKLDSAEGDGQVGAYLQWAREQHPNARRVLVYVTPDGRAPNTLPSDGIVVPMTWADVASVGLDVLHAHEDTMAPGPRAFVSSVLLAMHARFGGSADASALVESLHDAHPRACAVMASPGADAAAVGRLRVRAPQAVWHLQNVLPRAHPWTATWARRVAEVSRSLGSGIPLTPGAPHVGCPTMASWSLGAITDCLGMYLLCTDGRSLDRVGPRLWLALYAPGAHANELFARRDQQAAIDALGEPTRSALLGATPVLDGPGVWNWLRVGDSVALPHGWSVDDDARRVARAAGSLLAPHSTALMAIARDPSQRLYAWDLAADHGLPVDTRDREDLAANARPDAQCVLLVVRRASPHFIDALPASELGAALSAAYGGSASLRYTYSDAADAFAVKPTVVAVPVSVFHADAHPATRAAVAAVHHAMSLGAILLLLGDHWDVLGARSHLGELLGPLTPEPVTHTLATEVPFHISLDCTKALRDASVRDARWITTALGAEVSGAVVPVAYRTVTGQPRAFVAGWRLGEARVVFWAGGAYGKHGRPLRSRPESLARWWSAVTDFAFTL